MNLSRKITQNIKTRATNLDQLARAQALVRDVRAKNVQELGEVDAALSELSKVLHGIFGDMSAAEGHDTEGNEQLIAEVEALRDMATLAGNSYVFLLDPLVMAEALKEITTHHFALAIRSLDKERLAELRKIIEDNEQSRNF